MSHLDEGTLHALLDGELDTTETRQIEAHLDRCTTCGTRLEEIKQVRTEADRLIESLAVAPAQPDELAAASAGPAAPTPPVPAAPPPRPASDTWSGPILLIPELPEDVVLAERRRKRQRRWAAVIVLAIGLTYGGIQLSRRTESTPVALSGADEPSAAPAASAPVLSPQEAITPPARTTDTGLQAGIAMPRSDSVTSADNVHPSDLAAAGRASRAADAATPAPAPAPVQRNRRELAPAKQARPAPSKTPAAPEQSRQVTPPPPSAPEPAAAPAPAPVVTAPPPPPSLEERAAIYLRIGLDEAQRQLGAPMHVIEEMSPALVGLVQGKDSPGMDDTRPVVRAVYLDAANHLILLDQQRMRPGQSPGPASPLRVVVGDVLVYLRGGSNPNVLRNLIPRIR